MKKPIIVYQTDFGISWGVVSTMHGVSKQVDSSLEIYDATHLLPQFDTVAASYSLQYVMPHWPKGTIFVSVVDPGVGTTRKASVAKTSNGYFIVTPDNGSLTNAMIAFGIDEIREIDEKTNRYKGTEKVSIFHGRDLFAYCAAKLASGAISFEEVGPSYPVEDIICHDIPMADVSKGCVIGKISGGGDPFGNISINVLTDDFEQAGFIHGDMLDVVISDDGKIILDEKLLYHKSFGFVDIGEPVIFNNLASFVSIGLNQRSFAEKYNITRDLVFDITIKK